MANVISTNPIYVTEVGIISTIPLRIRKMVFKPAATGNSAVFTTWDENVTPNLTVVNKSTAIATSTFTSAGNFTDAGISAYDIVRVTGTDTGYSIGRWMVASKAAEDNTFVVAEPTAVYPNTPVTTDDTDVILSAKFWTPDAFLTIKGSGVSNDTSLVSIDFGDRGFWVPNLAMSTIDTSGIVYIFLV